MKNILFLVIGLFILSSCGKSESSSSFTSWEAVSFEADVDPIPIVNGIQITPDFKSTAEDIGYILEVDNETGRFTTKGSYTIKSVFSFWNVPDMKREYVNINKSGSFTKDGDNLLFDKNLFDVITNDVKWTSPDDMELMYILSEDGDRLMQEQRFENIEVQDGLNGNITLRSVWRKK